jgi:hypothetical protein
MIPSSRELNSKFDVAMANYFVLHSESFFEKADKFVELQQKFVKETVFEKAMLWLDMVVSPLITIIMCLVSMEAPSMFTLLGFHKVLTTWIEWFNFRSLAFEVQQWRTIVKNVNGPFISTNDPLYHVFVYADGMERLRSSLFLTGLSKKGTKSL